MKKNFVDRFFVELDRELGRPAEIILTGAALGALMGNIRPSLDIDFEIKVKGSKKRNLVHEAIRRASSKIGITVNYSEDIGHWSMISYLDYRKSAVPYQTIGRLRIKLMAPAHWTIGKMTRFLEIDIQDLLKVIKKKKLKANPLIRFWGRALRSSPLSMTSGHFRNHVVFFLRQYGKFLWGSGFDLDHSITLFKRSAGIKI